MTNTLPPGLHSARDYERLAAEKLDPATWAHLMDGAGDNRAVRANLQAFEAIVVTPRVLRDLTAISPASRIGGRERAHPIWLAPVAFQALMATNAERDTARGADAAGAPFVVSTLASTLIEDLASQNAGERWLQLYPQPAPAATADLVRRAEASGYAGVMVTVDAPVKPAGLSALRAGFRGTERAVNLERYEPAPPQVLPGRSRVQSLVRAAPTWRTIEHLRASTTLPLWIKGVLHADDARQAREAGFDGVVVSNHGGRTLDAAPTALSVLPAVRDAVGDAYPLMVDGGVRSGEDVFKAIALGADAVMVGRLQACALAVGGALGVAHMVRLLCEELEVSMALAGCATLSEVRGATVGRV